ncbi:hypothetical protein PC115_g15100 [Phytophthora cactorum]|uniref:AWS domain-containing protein n=1 Tax=Phytophthora cactorum TaxID=29920 RepID=A0A8T1BKX0_9STRA|nr:hypothetical protein PC115_g15100 [Phytophthora cactorum]
MARKWSCDNSKPAHQTLALYAVPLIFCGNIEVSQLQRQNSTRPTRARFNEEDITTNSERSVLQACAEYEDVTQNVYVSRARKNPLDDILYCRCEPLADWRLTFGTDCGNRATQTECVQGHCATQTNCGNQRIQRGDHAELLLRLVAGKEVSLVADVPISKDEFVIHTTSRSDVKPIWYGSTLGRTGGLRR